MTARRDWAWRWSPAWGPLRLSIHFEAPPVTPYKWLKRRRDVPYVPVRELPNRWDGRGGDERSESILFYDQDLWFLRSYLTPPPDVVAFDASVLDALIDGALGPFWWALVDDDYGEPFGAGDDAASLAWFLEAPPDEVHARCRAMFVPLVVDASTARDTDALLAMVNVAIDRWLETHPAQEHPRVLEVKSPKHIKFDWWSRLARPRVVSGRVTYI